MAWDYDPTPEFDAWFDDLSQADTEHVAAAIRYLCEDRPDGQVPDVVSDQAAEQL